MSDRTQRSNARKAILLLISLSVASTAHSQSATPTTSPTFEVASIRESKQDNGSRVQILPNGYSLKRMSLKNMISGAYGVRENLLSGAPAWTETTCYDLEAREDATEAAKIKSLPNKEKWEEIQKMMQALLAERFHLKATQIEKQLPIYELVIAKGGLKMKSAGTGNTYADGLKGPNGPFGAGVLQFGPGGIIGQAIPISTLADTLSGQVDRRIDDKTGLQGKYDVALHWSRDDSAAAADSPYPNFFTALQEQLGLKLDSAKGPTQTLVVEHVERPSEN